MSTQLLYRDSWCGYDVTGCLFYLEDGPVHSSPLMIGIGIGLELPADPLYPSKTTGLRMLDKLFISAYHFRDSLYGTPVLGSG
ncbi:hypothetical protein G9A89_000246 [Geosiphon pyriformis]|nr:hypothetical protein G9A89_000246 [Geosiphon pyriformis]